jgi:hypothetical protein
MQPQNFSNHTRLVTGYHKVLTAIIGLTLIIAFYNLGYNLTANYGNTQLLINAILFALFSVALLVTAFYARAFALKAQDRVIMLEESERHQRLANFPLPAQLKPSQIIALRFASDAEFVQLCQKAATEGLKSKQIKAAIQHWKADYYRV